MTKDSFISHASLDHAIAEAICETLEGNGLCCWIAPRDILPGRNWTQAIMDGVENSRTLVAVISSHSVASRDVLCEVQQAVNRGLQIIPLRIDNSILSKELDYLLRPTQWLDALTPPLESHLEYLTATIKTLLGHQVTQAGQRNSDTPNVETALRECSAPSVYEDARQSRPAGVVVRVPRFHCGSVVPPRFFVGQEHQLHEGYELIRARQSFMLVGDFRAGKTSFGKILIHRLMAENTSGSGRIIGSYLNLQQCLHLTPQSFLEHTVLCMIGEIARQVFGCKYSALLGRNPAELIPNLASRPTFAAFLQTYRAVIEQTHSNSPTGPLPLRLEEFVQFAHDLTEIIAEEGWSDFFIFFDEANRLPVDFSAELLLSNEEALNAAGIVSIYSIIPVAALYPSLRQLFGHQILLRPFSTVDELQTLLSRYYFDDESQAAEVPIATEAITEIWNMTGGRPYGVQVLAGCAFDHAHQDGAPTVTRVHVKKAHKLLIDDRHPAFTGA